MPSTRALAGALVYDTLPFEWRLRRGWERIRNRDERITVDGRAVRCDWKWASELGYARNVPSAARRLYRRAFADWPVHFAGEAPTSDSPAVTFLIGHRGAARLPLLQLALQSIAAQRGVPVECIVVEQSVAPEAQTVLPSWVRYVHMPAASRDVPYRRSAAFNLAVQHARGRILVFHDNDMLVPAGYAAAIVRRADEGWQAIDLKRFIFYLSQGETERVIAEQRLQRDPAIESVVQNLRGASVAITKAGFETIGGFDESFVGWGGEDVEFWERAETLRATAFGCLPMVHLWHAAQPEKLQGAHAPAVEHYYRMAQIPASDRIARLRGVQRPSRDS